MPLHDNYNLPSNWKYKEFDGYNPTGKTMSYERSHGEHMNFSSVSPAKTGSLRDKNTLCYLRFRNFKQCEGNTMHGKIHETGEEDFDEKCYGEMMEMI